MDDFVVRLRSAAERCEYKDKTDAEIKKQIIVGCRWVKLKEHILSTENISLDQILKKARSAEAAMSQARSIGPFDSNFKNEIKSEPTIAAVNSRRSFRKPMSSSGPSKDKMDSKKKCFACNFDYPHEGTCPAKGKKCNSCGTIGHFASSKFCKKRRSANTGSANAVCEVTREQEEDRCYLFATTFEGEIDKPTVEIEMLDSRPVFLIDSGAFGNIMDEKTFNRLIIKPELTINKSKLYPYGINTPLETLGSFTTEIKANNRSCIAVFKVSKGNPGNLLSYKTSRLLDLFNTGDFRCCSVDEGDQNESRYRGLMSKFSDVFTDRVGRLNDYKVKLHIDKSFRPVRIPYRRLPYHLVKATEDELDTLIKNDILEKPTGPVKWLSQMVVVEKPKKPGKVRITTDARVANKAIIREKYVTPTTEEIMYDLKGATVYSEIDFNKAFHQIELEDEDSKDITTIETTKGPFRFKTLNMGVHNASEIELFSEI